MNLFSRKPPDDKRPSETAITALVEALKVHPSFDDMTAEQRRTAVIRLLGLQRDAEAGQFDDDRRPE